MKWIAQILKLIGLHFRTTLIAGLLITIPVVVTFVILKFVFNFFDDLLQPIFDRFIEDYIFPGMGIVALVIIIYLAGLVTAHVMGRRLIAFGHSLVDLVPVVRTVYRAARQATDVLSTVGSDGKYSCVVLVDFPGYGLKSIGLVTATLKDQNGTNLLAVYMPTSPFPTSGFLVILPEDQVTMTDLPVDDAMKLIVSAGIMAPDKIVSNPDAFGGARKPPGYPFSTPGQAAPPQPPDSGASNQ